MTNYRVTCMLPSREELDDAVASLLSSGCDRADISVLYRTREEEPRSDAAAEAGSKSSAVAGAEAGALVGGSLALVSVILVPGALPFVAAGHIASIIGGAGLGGAVGGLTGALAELGISEEQGRDYDSRTRQGEAILSVKCSGSQDEDRLAGLLKQYNASELIKGGARFVSADRELQEEQQQQTPLREQIEARAYAIWEQEGRPVGRSAEHWMKAERELRAQSASLSRLSGDPFGAGRQGADAVQASESD